MIDFQSQIIYFDLIRILLWGDLKQCMLFGYPRKNNQLQKLFHYIYNPMKEQNLSPGGRFTIEKFSGKGPFYLQPQQRVNTLQNKVTFYEGQLDPLHSENSLIKQNHMNLARIVSISTEILRNLLPVGNTPAKKLKLEMATIDEIAKMIELDWKEMEQTIAGLLVEKKEMQKEIENWKQKLTNEQQRRVREVQQLQNRLQQLKNQSEQQIKRVNQQLAKIKADFERYKGQAFDEQALRDKVIDSCHKQLELFKYEAKCKYNDYERCISRLNSQMESNLLEFQQGKKMVKQIYEKLMNDKLTELAESYEIMLKVKEEEKFTLQLTINELTEENNRKLKEKDDQIQTLTNQNQAKKIQIKRLEDDLYRKKEELIQEIKDNKELQTQLLRTNEKNQAFVERIRKQEQTIEQQNEKIKATIDGYEQDIKMLKDKGSEAITQMIREKMELQKVISQKENLLKTANQALKEIEGQWKQKMEIAQKNWTEKQSQYTAEIVKQAKKIQEQIERTRRIKEDRDRELENISKEHQQLLKRLEKKFQESKQQYMRECTIKMRKLMDENQNDIARLKINLKKQLEAEMFKMEENMKKRQLENQLKLAEKQKQFQLERKKYEEQISAIKSEGQSLHEQLAKVKQEILQRESDIEKLKIDQEKALKKLELQNELSLKQMTEMIEQQMQQFLKELEDKQSKITSLQQQFNQERELLEKKLNSKDAEIASIKEGMQKEINSLKDNNGMMQMENRYKCELAQLQNQLKAKILQTERFYEQKLNALAQKHAKQIEFLIEDYGRKNIEAYNKFQTALINLASEFQKKSTFFNDNFLSSDIASKLEGLSQEQKISFIREKMEETVNLLIDKDNKIAQMEQQLYKFERKIEQQLEIRRKQLQIEKNILINKFNAQIALKEEDCRQRIEATNNQRKAFSEELFKQFCQMKEHHKYEFQNLERKYKQLEVLFSERPSRVEDVTKIKELISIQTQLDQEIIIYHKKMETANEIVKYLNLQLENYKETYDIFGPHEPSYNSKTISFPDDSHKMMEIYKQREVERAKEERQAVHFDKRNTESPDIKELRIFTEKEEQRSDSLVIEPKEVMGRSRKYSFVPEKLPPTRDRFKTEKISDRETELMGHAETFMKLIKKTSQDVSVIRELESNEDIKKKTYRRRKLKRLATGVVEHYF